MKIINQALSEGDRENFYCFSVDFMVKIIILEMKLFYCLLLTSIFISPIFASEDYLSDSQKLFEGGYEFANDLESFITTGNYSLFKQSAESFESVYFQYIESKQYKDYCKKSRDYYLLVQRLKTNIQLLKRIEPDENYGDFVRVATDINQNLLKLSEFNTKFYSQSIKNRFYLILFALLLLVIFITLLIFLHFKSKQTKKELSENRKFTDTVLNAIENERGQISNELHDTIAQEIRTIQFEAEHIKTGEDLISKKNHIVNLCTNCIQELRNICYDLIPPDLKLEKSSVQLENLMEFLCNKFNSEFNGKIQCSFRSDENITPIKNQKILLNIFRIVQEALVNIKNHSEATCCSVVIGHEKGFDGSVIYVTDDGIGIPQKILQEGKEMHFGLHSMKSRAESIGAILQIISEENDGTEIIIKLPDNIEKNRKGL
ncbi:ATP-binding protein [Treponema sp.]|uniref:sensor histidine kinase n=1 Tax=Treponema sp. TaxID=166 RepID=UPI0025F10345|nr:ATP-binding protein [Treponema sp.]MBR4323545.1 hypothetical protein [Treponema sp.]